MPDQSLFDAVAREVTPESSATPHLLLDRNLRIRGCNAAYARAAGRRRKELIGRPVAEAFPDNPDDPQANGSANLQSSTDTAMTRGATHNMWVQRYDVSDPARPGVFVAKVWHPTNSPVYDGDELIGVVHRVEEVTDLEAALAALARAVDAGDAMAAHEQLHTLAVFTPAVPADRHYQESLVVEIAQLRSALATRDVIGQAKGMIMERYDLDATAAFVLLVKLSQDSNTRVADLARTLVEVDHPPARGQTRNA